MWKLVTGEPYAGKSHVRFGGRGGAEPSLPLSLAVAGLPIDGLLVAGVEVVVAAREGFGAEEAAVRGERGGVRGFDDAVLAAVDEFFLGAGVAAPEDEYQVLPTVGEGADGLVGEGFPALVAV